MAKKKTRKAATGAPERKRKRRSDEELIDDLRQRIQELQQRKESRAQKSSPAVRAALAVVRQLDKALDAAAAEEDGHLRHALADARKPLEAHLSSNGVKLPKARLPRGRRPKAPA